MRPLSTLSLLPLLLSLPIPHALAAPRTPHFITVCGTAGNRDAPRGFNSESFFLAGTAMDFNDAMCRDRDYAITWVTLGENCRCRFYEIGRAHV